MHTPRGCFIRSSINIDQYFTVEDIVKPGETISSSGYSERIGGKGANAAVAICRAGGQVYFSGLIDGQSGWLKDALEGMGVDVDGLKVCEDGAQLPTGRAIIQVSQDTGENAIVLVPGTNHAAAEWWADLGPILDPSKYSHVLLQNEIPLAETLRTAQLAHSLGITTVFNPSPLPSQHQVAALLDWHLIDWLIVNQEEARTLRDRASSRPRASDRRPLIDSTSSSQDLHHELALLQDLIQLSLATFAIVITLGARGSLLAFQSTPSLWRGFYTPPSPGNRPVINTTGAGDCFTGFLVAELMRLGPEKFGIDSEKGEDSEDRSDGTRLSKLKESVLVASRAARLCVESHGTIDSYPSLDQVLRLHRSSS